MNYVIRIDIPVTADSPMEAAQIIRQWIHSKQDPFRPHIEVMNESSTKIIEKFDLEDF